MYRVPKYVLPKPFFGKYGGGWNRYRSHFPFYLNSPHLPIKISLIQTSLTEGEKKVGIFF